MASENSLLKWLVGCGVAGVLLVLICAGVGWHLITRGTKALRNVMEKQGQQAAFARSWQPPLPEAGPERLFPGDVLDFELADQDEKASVPEFGIDVPGHRAGYGSSRGKIEVLVYRANKLEKEALSGRLKKAVEEGPYNSRWTLDSDLGDFSRFDYTVSPPLQKGILWWSKDWLFLFRTHGEIDLEPFVEAYLRAIQQGEAAKPRGKAVGRIANPSV